MNYLQRVFLLSLFAILFTPSTVSALNLERDYKTTADSILTLIKENAFEQALQSSALVLQEMQRTDSLYLYLDFIKSIGTQFRKAGQPKIAERFFLRAAPKNLWRKPISDREKSKAAWLYVQQGYNYNIELGNYIEARKAYEMALNQLPSNELEGYQAAKYIRKPLGNIYTRLGEYTVSEIVLKEFIQTAEFYESYIEAAKGYSDLGLLYSNWEKTEQAQFAYEKGLSLPTVPRAELALLHINLSDLLVKKQDLDAASINLKEANILMQEEEKEEETPHYLLHFIFGHIHKKQALVHAEKGNYEAALAALDKEFHHLKLYYETTQRREFGKFHMQKGLLHLEMKDYQQALAQFQLALQSVLYNYQPKGPHDLPSPAACYAENTIMEALGGMAAVYQKWNETEPNTFYLEQALACYELMHVVEQALRHSYLYDSSKLFNLEESRQQSEQAIQIAYQLYQETKNKDLLYLAFVFAERNRSSLLREAFRTSRATAQAGISEEEQAQEGELQRAVSKAQEERFNLRSENNIPDSTIQKAEQSLLAAQDAMRNWLQELETRHPRYYQLKYADEVPTLSDLQQMLNRNEQLIEYFVGEEAIYVFKIDQKELSLLKLSKPAQLTERILAWRGAIENYQMSGVDRAQLTTIYQREGYLLYQELVAPVLVGTAGKSLLLVTSGMLDLLPFEALLTNQVTTGTAFTEYPYLLRDYPISYTYAASLQWSLHQLERHKGAVGGFAPSFNGQSGWPALSCSADLLETTIGQASGNLFVGDAATADLLQAQAARFRLLHLATHAQANPEQGDFSFIVFSDGQGGYDSLYAKDLYLYDLETELVILSACETALGTLYNSEGVISLARAFHYAGARSVVNTLWRINESANCDLLEDFYGALDKGYDKRTALQQAKLTYLQDADARGAHPVYWAGFQLLGNPRPMEAGFPWYVWLISGLLLIGGIGWWWTKRKMQQSYVS